MPLFPVSYYSDEPVHSPLKVSLFTKIHEMQRMVRELNLIVQLPAADKKIWLDENESFLQKLLDNLTQQSPLQFDEPDMDQEMMKLLLEYTAVLQDLMSVVQNIFHVESRSRLSKLKVAKAAKLSKKK